jgi:16S rRNA (cytosine1402-N4)-methyltransferase
MMIHKPVLLGEAIENLNLKPGMTAIDGTLGAGGHSIAILRKILPGGKLISIDWDPKAVENFEKKIAEGIYISEKEKITVRPASVESNSHGITSPQNFLPLWQGNQLVGHWRGTNDNYANLDNIMKGLPDVSSGVDAIFVDLGFSSDQIEDEKRGFSFLKEGPLDMRYSPETQSRTAADIVSGYSEEELAGIFQEYGEERYARRIARKIVEARKIRKLIQTKDLVEIILKSVPQSGGKGRIHPATRVFQALRIEVNGELENLKTFLEKATEALASGGRLAILSFHSLEDRIVKQFFQKESRDCVCPPKFPQCVCSHKKRLKIITKKPIGPSVAEARENPRARSAKMRVTEKVSMDKEQ